MIYTVSIIDKPNVVFALGMFRSITYTLNSFGCRLLIYYIFHFLRRVALQQKLFFKGLSHKS